MDYDKLKSDLRRDEGVRYKRYLDTVGVQTIGVGHNIDDDAHYPFSISDEPLSDADIDMLLEEDIAKAIAELDEHANWWRAMEIPRQLVLANMVFNLGWPRLSKFVNTLSAMERSVYDAAAAGMRSSKWATQVGERAERLAKMMETGEYLS